MNKIETSPGGLIADITKALDGFGADDSAARQLLNRLAGADPAGFFAAGIHVVAASKPSDGLRYLILTLAQDRRLSIALLDSAVCSLQEAVSVARAADQAGARLKATFETALNKALQGQPTPEKTARIVRILDMMAVSGGQTSWSSFQVELMAYPDKSVRSKAALLIGKSSRNVAWIARRLLDRDPRVQANAVEALWGLEAEEIRPHFVSALKSPNNRVAANAALGLYLCGDVSAMRTLQDMLHHSDPLFQISALWAIGETSDGRFLPILAEYYKTATGKLRLATVGAMARIRRREKAVPPAGDLQIHMSQASAQADGLRRLAFALSCHPARDLTRIKATEFAVWEDGNSVENYEVRLVNPPALLMAGFVAPWMASADEPYEAALREGLKQCLAMKRRDDLWRIDRYSIPASSSSEEKSNGSMPYDDSLMTAELKAARGCIADPDLLAKVLALSASADRAAADPIQAVERQCDAFAKRGGKRHVFLFLHDLAVFDGSHGVAFERLCAIAQESSAVLHCVCPEIVGEWQPLRDLCSVNPEASFTAVKLDAMVDALVDVYANLCSRFEISYTVPGSSQLGPPAAEPSKLKLKISSGLGQAELSFEVPRAQEATPLPDPSTAPPDRAPSAEPELAPAAASSNPV